MAGKKKYIGKNALLYVLNKLKGLFVQKEDGKGLSTKDFTADYEKKLKELNNYTHPTGDGNNHIPTGGTVGQILVNNGSGSVEWADNEGKTYEKATALADGLMSKEDFTKLQSIEENAQENKIEKIKVNGTEQDISTKEVDIDVDSILEGKDYQTLQEVESTITKKGYQTKSEVESLINNKMSSAMHYKGDVETYDELPPDAQNGDLYNIKTASEHNKAGDNAVWNASNEEWDILTGTIDTSLFITDGDLEEISNAEIDELFQ